MRRALGACALMVCLTVALGAVLALLLGPQEAGAAPTMQAQEPVTPAEPRRLTVLGRSTVEAVPDTAVVRIGVVTQAPTATLALERNSREVRAVLSQITDLGVAERAIQTGAIQITPIRATTGEPPPAAGQRPDAEITGYEVTNTVAVTVADLGRLGAVLGAAVEAGANQVYGVELRVRDRAALAERARAEAFRNARSQAQQLAQAAGGSLGQVLVIDAAGEGPAPLPVVAAESAASDVPVQPGVETVAATVRVTFALEPPQAVR